MASVSAANRIEKFNNPSSKPIQVFFDRSNLETNKILRLYYKADRLVTDEKYPANIKADVYIYDQNADKKILKVLNKTIKSKNSSKNIIFETKLDLVKGGDTLYLDIFDSNNNYYSTYSTIANFSSETTTTTNLGSVTSLGCDKDDPECLLEFFIKNVNFVASYDKKLITEVSREANGSYNVVLPIKRGRKLKKRVSKFEVDDTGGASGATAADGYYPFFETSGFEVGAINFNSDVGINFELDKSPEAFTILNQGGVKVGQSSLNGDAIDGAIEFDGNDFYITKNGIREKLATGNPGAGAQGPQGPAGPAGPAGASGSGSSLKNGGILNGSISFGANGVLQNAILNGSFIYTDGNETTNHILSSDTNGLATWTSLGSIFNGSGLTTNAAGSTSQVQFNNGGNFAADSNFNWDNANKRLGIGTASPDAALHVNGFALIGYPTTDTVAIGPSAALNSNGNRINALGDRAAESSIGDNVNAFGTTAARNNNGDNINALGYLTARDNEGVNVNALGYYAAINNNGDNVNALGLYTARNNLGDHVNAFGYLAAQHNLRNSVNAFGYYAGENNNGANLNTMGATAARYNQGDNVNAFGYLAARNNSGNHVNSLGDRSAYYNNGSYINALGYFAAQANNGDNVNALGLYSAGNNLGDHVNAFGNRSAHYNQGDNLNAIGFYTARYNIGDDVTALGSYAAYNNNGDRAIAIGRDTLYNNKGDYNIAIGYEAAERLSNGSENILIGHGVEAVDNNGDSQLNIGNTIYGDLAGGEIALGIAKTNPDATLELNGSFLYRDGNEALGRILTSDTNGVATWQVAPIGVGANGTAAGIAGSIQFSDGTNGFNSDAVNLFWNDTTNRLGIGIAAPTASIEVNGSGLIGITSRDLIALGQNSAGTLSSGTDINALGESAAQQSNGNNINALGRVAARHNNGDNINAFGLLSAQNNIGDNLNAFGYQAARGNNGSLVNAIGFAAASSNNGDTINALGNYAAQQNRGDLINAIGSYAAAENIGTQVSAIGAAAARSNNGDFVNALGSGSARYNLGNYSNFLGFQAGYQNKTNYTNAIGFRTGMNNNGSQLNAIGLEAARDNTGSELIAIGSYAAADNNGDNNIAIGRQSLITSNGDNNTAIGHYTGDTLKDGSNNLLIGYNVDAIDNNGDNQLNIGDIIYGDLANGEIALGRATNNPDATLELNGSFLYTDGNEALGRILTSDVNGLATWQVAPIGVGANGTAAGSAGAVQFSDGANGFNANSNEFFWDDSNDRLGIGTNSPRDTLEVLGNTRLTSDSNNGAYFTFQGIHVDGRIGLYGTSASTDNKILATRGDAAVVVLGADGGPVSTYGMTGNIAMRGTRTAIGGVTIGASVPGSGTHKSLLIGTPEASPNLNYGTTDIIDLGTTSFNTNVFSGTRPAIRYTALDHIFRVDNGTGANNPGLEVMRVSNGGSIGIGFSEPSSKLAINGSIQIVDGNEAAGFVLSSDANGLATWVSSASLSGTGDNMGDHIANQGLTMSGFSITGIESANGTNANFANGNFTNVNLINGDLSVIGGTIASDNLESVNHRYLTIPAFGGAVGDTYEFVSFTRGGGAHNFQITVTASISGYSVAKHYIVSTQFHQTAGAYQLLLPVSSTGTYSVNDFDLDIMVNSHITTLRLRKRLGTTSGEHQIHIDYLGAANTTITELTNTAAAVSEPAVIFEGNPLTQVNSRVGIGTSSPSSSLEVNGSFAYIDGNEANDYILKSNATGVASWVSPGSIINGSLSNYDSSGIAGSVQFSDGTNGFNSDATNLFWNDTTNRLGIGIAVPTASLHVNGYALIGDSSSNTVAIGNTAALNNTGSFVNAIGSDAARENIGLRVNALGTNTALSNNGADLNAIGYAAGHSNNGDFVNAIGYEAGHTNTESYNNLIGFRTGRNNTAGSVHAIGYEAARYNAGIGLIALGDFAGQNNNGSYSLAIGRQTLRNTKGDNNIAIGHYTGDLLNTGNANILLGHNVEAVDNNGNYQINIGDTIYGNTNTGELSLGIGKTNPDATLELNGSFLYRDGNEALGRILTSDANGQATWQASTGESSAGIAGAIQFSDGTNGFNSDDANFFWNNAGNFAIIGDNSTNTTKIGNNAATTNTGTDVQAIGTQALRNNTGSYSIGIGSLAGFQNNGTHLTALGYFAARNNNGDFVTALGNNAAYDNNGDHINAFGYNSARDNQGSHINALGDSSARFSVGDNVNAIGEYSAQSNNGDYVNVLGYYAGQNNNGDYVNALGYYAARDNRGSYVTAVGDFAGNNNIGDFATSVGYYAGRNSNGEYTTALGSFAGRHNTGDRTVAVGKSALENNKGDYNIALGYDAGRNLNNGAENILIGSFVEAIDNNGDSQLNIGDTIFGDLANGQVAIDKTVPQAKLDVNGDLMIGDSIQTCAATTAGLMRFNGSTSVMEYCNGSAWINMNPSSSASDYILLANKQTSGTGGGACTTAAWNTIPLNTIVHDDSSTITITANEATLSAGTYECEIHAPFFDVGSGMARLYNSTDAAVISYGSSITLDSKTFYSIIKTKFTLASSKDIRVEGYCGTDKDSDDYGDAVSIAGVDETYMQMKCKRY